ncbi:MAG TPA: LysM peptidoglycan-binding domain-containing protein [Myxococcales bacterium]|nr:LysM peptidoglycan-binding domain-containing protein [Myxococcales bacterium]
MRSAIAIVLASLCAAPALRAQDDPWGDAAREQAQKPAAAGESARKPDDSADDDPDQQAEVEKSAAELEEVRQAEEKAGLLPQEPGAGPLDAIAVGLDPADPVASDLFSAQGSGLDGAPLADPAPQGSASVKLPELAGISEVELRAKYDIPVELNDAVVAYIRFFQTDAREHFSKWLSRSTRYVPLMRQVLEKEGLPLDLVYLSMIESGFSAYAFSFAKAAGPWQFVVGTSRRYGLVTDFWVDERRDPYKATVAAARYLKVLKQRFHGDWYLAWAGYNAGEGRITRAIRKDRTTDFWRMMGKGRTLRAETRHYVPKLIAAALIAKHPERFGFHVDYEQPREAEEVRVPDATDLHVLAKTAGITFEELRDLNPELRRFCTPPGGYTLKLPRGTKEAFLAEYQKLDARDRLSFTEHRVEKGEPLNRIARAYGVSEAAILRTNGIKSYRQIKPGRILVIAMAGSSRMLAGSQLEDRHGRPRAQGRAVMTEVAPGAKAGTLYTVQPGDTLWSIAARFATTVDKLRKLNGLTGRRARELQVGQTLAIRET